MAAMAALLDTESAQFVKLKNNHVEERVNTSTVNDKSARRQSGFHVSVLSEENVNKSGITSGPCSCSDQKITNHPQFKGEGIKGVTETVKHQEMPASSVCKGKKDTKSTSKKEVSLDEIEEKDRQIEELRNRLSKLAGDQLREGNPNITDLSDANRPTKLAEKFSELYDNEWSDAYEERHRLEPSVDELRVIQLLLKVVDKAQSFCKTTRENQIENMRENFKLEMVLQGATDWKRDERLPKKEDIDNCVRAASFAFEQAQRLAASLSMPVLKLRFQKKIEEDLKVSASGDLPHFWKFVDKCIDLLWLMSVQNPPMSLKGCRCGDISPQNFREYTTRGNTVVALVWPSLHLFEDGPVMSKGVAIME